ncbi:MAG TPA: hypothetical protein VKY56_03735 [Chloroflexota bacterium]|nr:hypothetical protein [Chloroflexota bacterium]
MEEAGYQLRLAVPSDVESIRREIRVTLANPEGKPLRKRYEDAVQRHEMLVVTRFDPRERTEVIAGFVEWHTKVDGTITIRDAGTVGTEPQPGILRQLIRSLLHMFEPPSATVKVRADLPVWNTVFQQIPGFLPVGREYSRPYWRNIWEWTRENERAALRLATGGRPAGARRRRP